MIIRKAKYKNVVVKQRRQITPDVFGCDECASEIKEYPNEDGRLEATVFHGDDNDTQDLYFCSWKCVLQHIPKIKTNHFISLPFVYYDASTPNKRGADSLIKLLRQIKGEKE